MKHVLLLTLGVMLSSVPLTSQQSNNPWYVDFTTSGTQLIVVCKSAVSQLDAHLSNDVETGTHQEAYNTGYCTGLIAGTASSMNSNDGVDLSHASLDQLVRVVQKYLGDPPEKLDRPASWLIQQAIKGAFPIASSQR
jgi:hypothetical protein